MDLSPELMQHFGKSCLRLVFKPEQMNGGTELLTYGSYISNRMYDLLKHSGGKIAMTLPKRKKLKEGQDSFTIIPHFSSIKKRRSREIHKTETFLTFRVTYYSNEKFEELVTAGLDVEGNLVNNIKFPYSLNSLQDATFCRFPYTRKQSKTIYARCLQQVEEYAEQQALMQQEKLAGHYHQDVIRLEGYYQQMINEIPELTSNRQIQVYQFQQEYERKVAEEFKKCHVQIVIEPVNFCTVAIPFRRYQYILEPDHGTNRKQEVMVETYFNLFSGVWLYPKCTSCGRKMKEIGICDVNAHPVCRDCLAECHVCGSHVCRDCGLEQCADCHEGVCHQCSEQCHLCGKRYCTEHLLECRECRKHVCRQCTEQCAECHKLVGNIHIIECDISHKRICFDCLVTCPCCDQHVAQSHAHTCAFCGQQMCSECTFRCDVCGENFCVHHVTECEISGKMICPEHIGVCESCSKRVSMTHMNTCDACRKKICTHCSTCCHECGVFFCEKHAREMTKCPGCGEIYCSLCYSGQGVCTACQNQSSVISYQ